MLCRYVTQVKDIKLALRVVRKLVKKFLPKQGRGRKPKHGIAKYATILVLKQANRDASLRFAEANLSVLVCGERVDHSVIAYWENHPLMQELLAQLIAQAGKLLDSILSTLFSMVDATEFTTWHTQTVKVWVCNHVAEESVYPVGISFVKSPIAASMQAAVPEGEGALYADSELDNNDALGVFFAKGYTPVVHPHSERYHGYFRRKARTLWKRPEHRLAYRQRGRGESVFGSLTNGWGDRLTTRTVRATQTRVAATICAYQVKLLIRAEIFFLEGIVRHARYLSKVVNERS